jgi:hypothetical protein
LFTIGWYDTFAAAGWRDLAAYGGPSWLVGAPWAHMPWSPDPDVATDAHLAFFDVHVARRAPTIAVPRVQSRAVGGSGWSRFDTWPAVECARYGLASEGRASTRFGDGALVRGPGTGPPNVVVHQPLVPVPSVGNAYSPALGIVGSTDQRAVQDRTDVLVFTSEPFARDVDVFGAARVSLDVQSHAPTNDACVTLCAVAPGGEVTNIAFGAARGAGRLEFDLAPTHAVLAAGHRLRVAIAPSAYPELDVNTSAGLSKQVTRALASSSWIDVPLRGR